MKYEYNLGQRFSRITHAHGDRCAVLYPDGKSHSYSELRGLTNQTARFLMQHGIKRGDVVALFSDKSPPCLCAMLACIQIGAIYTNLDPESPLERVRRIADTCSPKVILCAIPGLAIADGLSANGRPVIYLDDNARQSIANSSADDLDEASAVSGHDPAYIMFTSGSTGYPKGAAISHASLLNFIDWAAGRFGITSEDRLTHVNPSHFDNSVFDFYGALFNGASLVPVNADQVRDPRLLAEIVTRTNCTIWFSVPSLLVYLLTSRALTSSHFTQIRKIIFGGEGFPKPKLRQLYDLYADRADLENVYGPTECTCICSANTIREEHFEDSQHLAPLGFLAPNFGYEILPVDGQQNVGELFLTGPQVGLGYYNDPERTARAFVQNPMQHRFRDIGYRTGDLIERDPQGELHFRGRIDFQIKHMGYRIELEEVEAAMNSLPGVNEAAAVYQKLGDGLGQIVGFLGMNETPNGRDLRAEVARLLPSYMLPRRINVLLTLPKNQNGKIDRPALLAVTMNNSQP